MMVRARWFLVALSLALCCLAIPAAGQAPVRDRAEYYAGGLPSAPVKIEVFSDYQCPACRTFYLQTLRSVLDSYSKDNRVSVVYHDFPLAMHRHAREAARYALAAQRLGREQWSALSDALYSQQNQWSIDGRIDQIAASTLAPGDYAGIKELLQDRSIDEALERELSLGRALKVSATPTFFVLANGRAQRVVGGVSYPVLQAYLNRLLK